MTTLALKETEALFNVLDQSAQLLRSALDTSYVDAFIESGDNLIAGNVQVEDGKPARQTVEQLQALYDDVHLDQLETESIRQAIQLGMLKAIKEDEIQGNHQLTPDTIGMVMGYLVIRLVEHQQKLVVLDPAVGTANLLTTIMNQLSDATHHEISGIGIDNDDSMLAVADINVTLQHAPVELRHQDALGDLLGTSADLVVSDLPIGYYPLDQKVTNFKTRAKEGHSYVHHLLLEQAMQSVKPGGFGIFLVPSQLFQSAEAKTLLGWLQDSAYLQAFLNLPKDLFAANESEKAVLLLQRHGGDAKQAGKVMLGEFPSFKDQDAFSKFMAEIVDWELNDLLAK
ncbi:class I SAM-dependent methyltransferase [Secundilactobacillus paracollinoides]|uniref:class I SAM-dependent methyltransferase n=1 Tax=Secundilactobacillus paracollinoides TaxID=240427 RepID=UPI0006EF4274|nr:adenine-specific DNA methylase [Secundilactobacillus paracollinoides DSM 15502 = JCM 11969]